MSKTITDFKEQVRRHFRVNGRWLKQAQESYAFEAGKQWSDADMAVMKKRNRPTFVANSGSGALVSGDSTRDGA